MDLYCYVFPPGDYIGRAVGEGKADTSWFGIYSVCSSRKNESKTAEDGGEKWYERSRLNSMLNRENKNWRLIRENR